MVGVVWACLHYQLSAIQQWQDVWIGPCLTSLSNQWFDVYPKGIVFFMTMCKDEYMSEEAIRKLSHQSKLKHKY